MDEGNSLDETLLDFETGGVAEGSVGAETFSDIGQKCKDLVAIIKKGRVLEAHLRSLIKVQL